MKKRNKRILAKDFVGWKSDDGLLEVVGIHGKQGRITTFKVVCHKCKEDKELFPDGYFVSNLHNLRSQHKPCGCSKRMFTEKQYMILLERVATKNNFIVNGLQSDFNGIFSKVNCTCKIDGCTWTPTIERIINESSGCPECAVTRQKTPESVAESNCNEVCREFNYQFVGFPDGYKNAFSRFEYNCSKHGIQNVSYNDFINNGSRCPTCWKERQLDSGNGNGYYPERKDEQDFLYVLDFDSQFIKVGRSFDVAERIKDLRKPKNSGIKNIIKLRTFTATHQEIYDLEQDILEELRERGFQHYVPWSTECFENDCMFVLNNLLNSSGLNENKEQ